MKTVTSIILVAFIFHQVIATPIPDTPPPLVPIAMSANETGIAPANSTVINIFQIMNSVIHGLLTALQTTALSSGQTVQSMLNIVRDQKLTILHNLNATLFGITGDAEAAYQQIANIFQIILITGTECTNQQSLFLNRTMGNLTSSLGYCAGQIRTEISNSTVHVWSALEGIVYTMIDVANQATTCGVAFFGDLLNTGTCLNDVVTLAEQLANNNFIQLAASVANLFTAITSAPTNLAICGGSHLVKAALSGSTILTDITMCTATAIASMQ